MNSGKWNRKPKRRLDNFKEKDTLNPSGAEYKVARVKPRKRKRKHPGFTTMPTHRLWIFESNKPNGGNHG